MWALLAPCLSRWTSPARRRTSARSSGGNANTNILAARAGPKLRGGAAETACAENCWS